MLRLLILICTYQFLAPTLVSANQVTLKYIYGSQKSLQKLYASVLQKPTDRAELGEDTLRVLFRQYYISVAELSGESTVLLASPVAKVNPEDLLDLSSEAKVSKRPSSLTYSSSSQTKLDAFLKQIHLIEVYHSGRKVYQKKKTSFFSSPKVKLRLYLKDFVPEHVVRRLLLRLR